MTTWNPDFCPNIGTPRSCIIDVLENFGGINSYVRKCPHHASVQTLLGLTDHDLFVVVLQSSRVKEAARSAARLELRLAEEDPQIPFRVESSGNFTLGLDDAGVRFTGWPSNGAQRTNLLTAIAVAVEQVYRPAGTSAVIVA